MAGEEVTVAYQIQSTNTVAVVIVVFISVAFYNVLELVTLTFTTFRKYSGLYFWSFIVCTCGIGFNSVGYLLNHLQLTPITNLIATIILIGWTTMITGQSLVLYSRLHLVLQNRIWLRAVLIMIIVDALWLHVPVIVLVYGVNSSNPEPFQQPYSIYEKIQLTAFFIQECIISAIYLWRTVKILQMEKNIGNSRTRQVMSHLIYVNIIIILLDVSILTLEYSGHFAIQTAWKPLVYSVKLKMEFSILNRLRDLVKDPPPRGHGHYGNNSSAGQGRGLALATFEPRNKTAIRGSDQEFNTGYQAHVGRGDAATYQKRGVLKTTEITVHADERGADSDPDAISIDRNSVGESVGPDGMERGGCTSSASSKVQFAHAKG